MIDSSRDPTEHYPFRSVFPSDYPRGKVPLGKVPFFRNPFSRFPDFPNPKKIGKSKSDFPRPRENGFSKIVAQEQRKLQDLTEDFSSFIQPIFNILIEIGLYR